MNKLKNPNRINIYALPETVKMLDAQARKQKRSRSKHVAVLVTDEQRRIAK